MTEDPGSSSLDIAVVAHDPRWRATAPGAAALARRAAAAVFGRLAGRPDLAGPLEATIVLADDALLRDLNRAYRGRDRPTNVLSFPGTVLADAGAGTVLADVGAGSALADAGAGSALADVGAGSALPGFGDVVPPGQPRLLGDVVLARQTLLREAAEQDKTLDDHLVHLVIHGVLHLLGYDHDAQARASEMEALEISILADLGVADPYEARS